jgi:transglutaminase-like putative cysteine protease
MAPGSIQQLLLDDSAAFRVDFDGPPPARAQLYWRGPVLTDFDGATWTRRPAIAANDAAYSVPAGAALAKYDIALEPDDVPWLFALDIPLDAPADAVRNSDMTLIHMNADRRRPAPVTEALRYQVRSALDYRLEANLDPAARAAALALPPDFNPRSVALGARWRRDLDDEQRIVASALELFHNEFFYTLSPPEFGRDSIDEFLFAGKRGFCEHYAAAFVFLMRAAGIPARIVTGYQGGYFNKVGNYLIVRQSDAHAWSEVWLAGRGWVRVDPTAAVSPQRVELGARAAALATGPWYQTSWLLSLRNQFDLVNRGWNSLIVQFNAVRQRSLLTPFGIDQADYAALTWVLIGTSSILLGLVSFWVMRNPRRRIDPLDAAYDELCAKLARAGVARAPNEGPLDFAARVQSLHASRGPFVRQAQALLSQYVSLRYARALISMPERENFARAVRGLRVAARA